ncbi:hypothetical protein MSAN_02068000 [Mycena sanguinolenta]|uniref:DUF6699 domain-containing protein n=1 Tax=Mycena sanguinolenta TaxID=230812 RepID=A0A8H7CMQ5_9AGAR|nr:hypothetical protein MSAN_02068000 [Mycena sanguinolenta]
MLAAYPILHCLKCLESCTTIGGTCGVWMQYISHRNQKVKRGSLPRFSRIINVDSDCCSPRGSHLDGDSKLRLATKPPQNPPRRLVRAWLFTANKGGPTPFFPKYPQPSQPLGRAHNFIALSRIPLLNYDITLHPSTISTHYLGLSAAGFLEPAVYPPQSSITLVTPHLPWAIVVYPSNGRFVTVGDVLNALHGALRVNVTAAEFEALGTPTLKRQVSLAYQRRYERLRGHRGYREEKNGGVKRVDFLIGFTKFQGISPVTTSRSPDVWQLNIS